MNLLTHVLHLLFEQPLDLAARSAARLAHLENFRQLRQREADRQSIADQSNAVCGFARTQAVVAGRAAWNSQQLHSLIVAQSVGADPGKLGELPREKIWLLNHAMSPVSKGTQTENRTSERCFNTHYQPWNRFQGQVFLRATESEGKGKLVRAEGLEPSRALRPNGFSCPLRLSPPLPSSAGFGVWTIPSPCPDLAPGLGAARLVSTPSQPFRAGLGSGSPCYRVPRI